MKKREHFRILAGIILITVMLSISGMIQGFQIVTFALLSLIGLYFSFFFIKYVYAQKDFPIAPKDADIDM
jgi:hypothetical protein